MNINFEKLNAFVESKEIDRLFHELDQELLEGLRALGVPENSDPLPRGEGYVYEGSAVFRWLWEPEITWL